MCVCVCVCACVHGVVQPLWPSVPKHTHLSSQTRDTGRKGARWMKWQTSYSPKKKRSRRNTTPCTLLPGSGKMSFVNKWPIHFYLTSMDPWHLIYLLRVGSNGVKKGRERRRAPAAFSITNVATAKALLTGRASVTGGTSDQRDFTNTTSQLFQTTQAVNIRFVLKKADVFFSDRAHRFIFPSEFCSCGINCVGRRGSWSVTHTVEGKALSIVAHVCTGMCRSISGSLWIYNVPEQVSRDFTTQPLC